MERKKIEGRGRSKARGSITLIQAAIVLVMGLGLFVMVNPFWRSLEETDAKRRCLAEMEAEAKRSPFDLANPSLNTKAVCD